MSDLAFTFANGAVFGFVVGWFVCRVFLYVRERRRPPPF